MLRHVYGLPPSRVPPPCSEAHKKMKTISRLFAAICLAACIGLSAAAQNTEGIILTGGEKAAVPTPTPAASGGDQQGQQSTQTSDSNDLLLHLLTIFVNAMP